MPVRSGWLYAGIFLAALATLLLELIDTRLLSVLTWYHLSFFAVSLAMLGMAGGAVWVFLGGEAYKGERAARRLPAFCLALAVAIPTSHLLNLVIPIQLLRENVFRLAPMDVVSLVLAIVCLTVPFVISGVVLTLALTRVGGRIGRLYAADLAGASLGCLAVVVLLEWTDISTAAFACGALAACGAVAFERALAPRVRRRSLLVVAGLAAAAVANGLAGGAVGVLHPKGSRLPADQLELSRWNSHSYVVVKAARRGLPFYWGASQRLPDRKVNQSMMQIDGLAGTPLTQWRGDPADLDWVESDVTYLPYHLRAGDTAIVGVGGGRDILAAIRGGSASVTGIELNGIFVDILENSHRSFTRIADQPNVRLVHDEARSYLARTDERFDVLQISLIDTWAATGAGAFTLSENGLYTREGWAIFLDRLAPGGILSVSRWFHPTRTSESVRLLALGVAALLDRGVERPADHIALVRRGPVATMLTSLSPLTAEDIGTIRRVAGPHGFEILALPGSPPASPRLGLVLKSRNEVDLRAATRDDTFDYSAPTDDRPYFFNMLKLTRFHRVDETTPGVVMGNLRATTTLVVLLVVAALMVVTIIGFPLLRGGLPRMSASTFGLSLGYFAAIGVGFMLVEIPLLQRFSVYLGHPAFAYSVILFSVILFTGTGSLASDRLAVESRAWQLGLPALLAASILLTSVALQPLTEATQHLGAFVRAAIVIATVAPVSILMGFCFPLGIRLVDRIAPDATAWMWGVNGACGVLASIVAVVISISLGIGFNLLIAAALYASLALLAPMLAARGNP